VDVDGSMEEGSPMIAPGARTHHLHPRPSGLHWYHTHAMANRNLKRGLYSGQFGVLLVEPALESRQLRSGAIPGPARLGALLSASDDGSLMVNYVTSSINGRMLGPRRPIQVREGQRVLFHILNASATEPHWLTLPGHQFQVLALDGRTGAHAGQRLKPCGSARPSGSAPSSPWMRPASGFWANRAPHFATPAWALVVEYAARNRKAAIHSRRPNSPGIIAPLGSPPQRIARPT
jgi:hypothetical protein